MIRHISQTTYKQLHLTFVDTQAWNTKSGVKSLSNTKAAFFGGKYKSGFLNPKKNFAFF